MDLVPAWSGQLFARLFRLVAALVGVTTVMCRALARLSHWSRRSFARSFLLVKAIVHPQLLIGQGDRPTLLIGQSDRSLTASDWSRRFSQPKLLIGRGDRLTLLIGQSDRSLTASDWSRRFFRPKLPIDPASYSLDSSDWSMRFCVSSPREVRHANARRKENNYAKGFFLW